VNPSALRAIADAADALSRLARAALEDGAADPSEHLSLEEARSLGRFKTTRPIKDAIRARELVAFGRQRSRTVRRGEFLAWLESHRARPVAGVDDADIERRVARLSKTKKTTEHDHGRRLQATRSRIARGR
jgi:hypothetical protein